MSNFDPNDIAIPNGNIFGFPINDEESDIVILPVPWDATASYGSGSADGPKAILNASLQIDFHHNELENAHETKVFMTSISEGWKDLNEKYRIESAKYIDFLENGGQLVESEFYQEALAQINAGHYALKSNLKEKIKSLFEEGKFVGVLGGEHSAPLALIESLDEVHEEFGILQIDAHADLREAYEGFEQSHASIMYNVLESCSNMSKLVQVGVRDIAPIEVERINSSEGRIQSFFDWDLKKNAFSGQTWSKQVDVIIDCLPQKVYVSFDIDGLKPNLCPNTGTPVPGGLELEEVNYLLFKVIESGRDIIGFDLSEVTPGQNNQWDANVGARTLWNLVVLAEKQRRKNI